MTRGDEAQFDEGFKILSKNVFPNFFWIPLIPKELQLKEILEDPSPDARLGGSYAFTSDFFFKA